MVEQVTATFERVGDLYHISFKTPPFLMPDSYYQWSLKQFSGKEKLLRAQFVYRAAVRQAFELLDYAESLDEDDAIEIDVLTPNKDDKAKEDDQ